MDATEEGLLLLARMRNEHQPPTWEPFTEKYYEAVRGLRERRRSQIRFEKDHPSHVGTDELHRGDLYICVHQQFTSFGKPR